MRSKEPSTHVYFVRHGKTDFPDNRIYCDGVEDPPLSAEGEAQAAAMATYFQGLAIDALIASPAARTWATAQAIAQVTGCAIERAPWLVERRYGIWEGLFFDDIQRQYPDDYQKWKAAPVEFTPPGGESMADLHGRLQPGLGEVLVRYPGKTIVLVSHVGPIRAFIADAFAVPTAQSRQLRVDYASISKIDYGNRLNNFIFLNAVRYKTL